MTYLSKELLREQGKTKGIETTYDTIRSDYTRYVRWIYDKTTTWKKNSSSSMLTDP